MDNRAHAIIAVSFLIVFSIGAVVVYYWLAADHAEPRFYRIVTSQSVGSLQSLSPVTFKGLLVGHVQSVTFSEQQPAKVKIIFSVRRDAMVTKSTYGVLARQGIVGGTALALKLGDGSRAPLPTRREAPARIPLRKGFIARIKSKSMESLNRIDDVLASVQALLDKDNLQHVSAILAQADEATQQLVSLESSLLPVAKTLPGLVAQVRQTLQQGQKLLTRISQLAQAAKQPLAQFGETAESAQATMHEIRQQLLPELARLSDNVARTSRALRNLSQQLQAQPQSLLFGTPEPAPGPGEPGFGPRNPQ